eukprot:1390068-Amorphochlora_amoeboformis.AAC.2
MEKEEELTGIIEFLGLPSRFIGENQVNDAVNPHVDLMQHVFGRIAALGERKDCGVHGCEYASRDKDQANCERGSGGLAGGGRVTGFCRHD